jgi:hypothetical protein
MLLLTSPLSLAVESGSPLPFVAEAEFAASASLERGPSGEPAIKVTGGSARSSTTIIDCSAPKIETHQYVVRGQVKYEGVSGDGYLELWNNFGSKGKFFTRSLGEWGAMRKIQGSSGWRQFELPFCAEPGMRPEKLTLNVVLPGAGTVVISQPSLFAIDLSDQWWSEPQAGLYGAALGSCLGILGAMIEIFASRQKMRSLTLELFAVGLTISSICLVVGLAAVVVQQPWHVYYSLLLGGGIGVCVLGGNLWNLLRRYRADELRRMAAVDA